MSEKSPSVPAGPDSSRDAEKAQKILERGTHDQVRQEPDGRWIGRRTDDHRVEETVDPN